MTDESRTISFSQIIGFKFCLYYHNGNLSGLKGSLGDSNKAFHLCKHLRVDRVPGDRSVASLEPYTVKGETQPLTVSNLADALTLARPWSPPDEAFVTRLRLARKNVYLQLNDCNGDCCVVCVCVEGCVTACCL